MYLRCLSDNDLALICFIQKHIENKHDKIIT